MKARSLLHVEHASPVADCGLDSVLTHALHEATAVSHTWSHLRLSQPCKCVRGYITNATLKSASSQQQQQPALFMADLPTSPRAPPVKHEPQATL